MQTTTRPKALNGKGPNPLKDGKGPLSSKGGSIAAAVLAAALAAVVIVVFINQYKDSVNRGSVPTPVLVADKQIEKGASGATIGELGLFKATDVPKDQLKPGAITDAAVLKNKVAAVDVLPGQQLTIGDFKPAGSGMITKLAADQRAISLPLDRAHGMIGDLKVGDHVDVLAGFLVDSGSGRPRPIMRTIAQDALVLGAPDKKPAAGAASAGGATSVKEISLRVTGSSAPKIAFASEFGKVWLALRPANGDVLDKRSLVTIESLLFSELANSTAIRRGA